MKYMAHYEKSPRMWSQGLHAHDYYEIYIHLGGGRYYCIDDAVYALKPNQMFIIPPLHMHGLICDRDLVDYERCYLCISPETLQKCDIGRINISSRFDLSISSQNNVSDLSDREAIICKQALTDIERLCEIDESKKQMEIYSKILQILQIAGDKISMKEITPPAKVVDNPIIEILRYINENYTQDINIKTISRLFNISESSLSHNFREHVGKSVYEYILYKRIIMAKELMYSTASLTEIAFKCGFKDYSNFLRVFKKQNGISPKEYREDFPQFS